MKNLKRLLIACICFIIILPSSMTYAHSGRTDSSGGHRDNKNASGLGYYHYHCGGNPPHLHSNGTCPYSPAAAVQTTKKVSKYYRTATVKRVRKKLNNKGCKCGKADGIYGKDTKKAIRKYQKKMKIRVNGKINNTLLKKLKINV